MDAEIRIINRLGYTVSFSQISNGEGEFVWHATIQQNDKPYDVVGATELGKPTMEAALDDAIENFKERAVRKRAESQVSG